ncbi:OmpA family protein [Janibacter sp. GXQ6167]|uniref:OmpA family protein n=1 Tax=Janibacter sp. GXQ6167 TaxID=3240791 RepID=UPI003525C6E8
MRRVTKRTGTRIAAVAVIVALATACTSNEPAPPPAGSGESAPSSETSQSPSPSVSPGTDYALPTKETRPEPEVVETKTKGDSAFSLVSVVRIADDRVVLSGVLTPADPVDIGINAEPGYVTLVRGGDFSSVELTAKGDDLTYLPVRNADGDCLCSSVRPGFEGAQLPVSVVMSAPKDATTVDLTIAPFGTFAGVEVREPAPTEGMRTPFGLTQTLVIDELQRADGRVTAGVRVQQPGEPKESYTRGVYNPPLIGEQGSCLRSVMVIGGSRGGWAKDASCPGGNMPAADQQVRLDLDLGDPGGDTVVVLPSDGFPIFGAPTTGEAAEGTSDVAEFSVRTRSDAATVERGEKVKVDLATEVLFAFDSDKLTSQADASLDAAAEALTAQDGRTVAVAGHTDSQGSASYNLALSKRRAEAVRAAIAKRLGSGWTITARGYGQTKPAAEEKGSPAVIKAAQQRNRRVEITATK